MMNDAPSSSPDSLDAIYSAMNSLSDLLDDYFDITRASDASIPFEFVALRNALTNAR